MSDAHVLDETQLKLYLMLVDQIQKYTTIFWQFPIALIATNALAFEKFLPHPVALLALSILNVVLTYAFQRMIIQQRALIEAAKHAESLFMLSKYGYLIPKFKATKLKSPYLMMWTLWFFVLLFLTIAVITFIK